MQPNTHPTTGRPYGIIATQNLASGPDKRRWNAYMPCEMPFTAAEEINGPDRRTAAMRCWCVHKLGEEIELPDQLKGN